MNDGTKIRLSSVEKAVANDNGTPEARLETAVLILARLIGRQPFCTSHVLICRRNPRSVGVIGGEFRNRDGYRYAAILTAMRSADLPMVSRSRCA